MKQEAFPQVKGGVTWVVYSVSSRNQRQGSELFNGSGFY